MRVKSKSQVTFAVIGFTMFFGGLALCGGNFSRGLHFMGLFISVAGAVLADLGFTQR